MKKTKFLSFFYIILSSLCYSFLTVFVKQLAGYSIFTILFFRYLIPLLILLLYFCLNKNINFISMVFDRPNMGFLLFRSFVSNLGVFLIFYSMELLPPSDSNSLYLTYPIILSIFGVIFFNEKISINKILAYLFSVLGVIFIFRPNLKIDHFPFFIGISASLCLACSYFLVGYSNKRDQKNQISPLSFLFNLTFIGILMTLPFIFFYDISLKIEYKNMLNFLIIGILSLLIQFFSTMGYQIGKASEISVFHYFSLFFSMIFSIIFLGIYPDIYSILGVLFIFLSGFAIYINIKKFKY